MKHKKYNNTGYLAILIASLFLFLFPGQVLAEDWVAGLADAAGVGDPIGKTALFLFDYSLGINNNNNCFSCNFLQQFMVALSSFSAAIFMYFRAFFITLIPIIMAIWIAWSVGRLMVYAGADGKEFVMNLVKKSTLFLLLWLLLIGTGGDASRDPSRTMLPTEPQAPWSWFGPVALDYGFKLGNEIRTITGSSLILENGSTGLEGQLSFNCEGVGNLNPQLRNNPDTLSFAHQASEITCAMERTHIVGMAAGLAMIEGAWSQVGFGGEFGWSAIWELLLSIFNAFFITLIGLLMLFVFALSVIWFIFLTLDIVVKVLIIAGLSPIILLFALLAPTRKFTWNAVKGVIGALTTALGLAIVATLAFYLIINTVEVYNTANNIYDPELKDIEAANPILGLRQMISRLQLDDASDPNFIPMTLSTPWLHYLVLVSLSIFALGKKIISMIEQIIGAGALSEMADSARKTALVAGAAGIWGGYIGSKVGLAGAKGGALGGAAAYGGAKTAWKQGLAPTLKGVADRVKGNPFKSMVRMGGGMAKATGKGMSGLKSGAKNAGNAKRHIDEMQRKVDEATDN